MSIVSIVIPAFNAEAFIRGAIDSALAQTYADREIIVVDDGSTDATASVLAGYGSRIRIIHQSNGGTAAACNAGVAAAKGSWVAFLDADDEWLPEKLASQLRACSGFAISHTDSYCFGDGLASEVLRSSLGPMYQGRVLKQLLVQNFITKSSVLMLRDTFLSVGGFSARRTTVEDWPLWLKVCASHELGYLPEPVVRYRVHAHSKSMKSHATHAARLSVLAEAFGPRGVGEQHQDLRTLALGSAYRISSHFAAQSGDWRFAVRCALAALRYEPAAASAWKTLTKSALIPLGVKY